MGNLSSSNRLDFNYKTQNSRVETIYSFNNDSRKDSSLNSSIELIEKCYRQIFFHSMNSDRDLFLESQFKSGSIETRDFIRGLLLSDRFYRGYVACNNNNRLVEQVIGRVLGRPIYSIRERLSWSILIADRGFNYFVDTILDSDEYMQRFGYDDVPRQVNRTLPGKAIGEIPIYQRLPRYGESWRDRLIQDNMMMSIEAFNVANRPRTSVDNLIYNEPKGRALIIWRVSLSIGIISSVVIVLSIFDAMFNS
ncbi:phycobilisome rod-core linker polypeptide [bacterium]|nr:phycobilisome rod-core linker polypeptide [bacterium]